MATAPKPFAYPIHAPSPIRPSASHATVSLPSHPPRNMGYPANVFHVRDMLPVKFGEPSTAPYVFRTHYPRYAYSYYGGAPAIPPTVWRYPPVPAPEHHDVYMPAHVLADRQNDAHLRRTAPSAAEQALSPTRSDSTMSVLSAASPALSSPPPVHVVCTAPLVAPKPLPYHSPTFLQFDLPDDDEDLSHPPYCSRPHKRKRQETDLDDDASEDADARRVVIKRRAADDRRAHWHAAAHAVQPRPVPHLSSYSYPMPPPVFAHATYR